MALIIRRLIRETSAQDIAEYGIALAIIGVGAGLVAVAVAGDVNSIWSTAQAAVHAAV